MSASALTVAQFREMFPVLTEALFPDTAVQIRLTMASEFFSSNRWGDGDIRDYAMGLYCAHYLTAYGSQAECGGSQGSAMGVVSSKSVDGASVSFDTSSTTWSDAGFWNATPYGRELFFLMRIYGAGAVQL